MRDLDIAIVRNLKRIERSKRMAENPQKAANERFELFGPESVATAQGILGGEELISANGAGPIRLKSIELFDLASIMLPVDMHCEIKREAFEYLSGTKHEIYLSIQALEQFDGRDMQFFKKHYAEMNAQSKQKTVWLAEGEAYSLGGKRFCYLLAKHMMPEKKHMYNLLAQFELGKYAVWFTFSAFGEGYSTWLDIFAALLLTVEFNGGGSRRDGCQGTTRGMPDDADEGQAGAEPAGRA